MKAPGFGVPELAPSPAHLLMMEFVHLVVAVLLGEEAAGA